MSNNANDGQGGGLTLGDIYFVLFRHKVKILVVSAFGILAAALYFFMVPPPYQSQAYLTLENFTARAPAAPGTPETRMNVTASVVDNQIAAEMQILGSFDTCKRAATNIGAAKILAMYGGGKDASVAAALLQISLTIERPKQTALIHVSLAHKDAQLVQPLLTAVLTEYRAQAVELHNHLSAFEGVIEEKTSELNSKFMGTQDKLAKLLRENGVVVVDDDLRTLTANMSATRRLINDSEADLAEKRAVYDLMTGTNQAGGTAESLAAKGTNGIARSNAVPPMVAMIPATNPPAPANPPIGTNATPAVAAAAAPSDLLPTDAKLQEYRAITNLYVAVFQDLEKLSGTFQPESREIRTRSEQLKTLEAKRLALVTAYPSLTTAPSTSVRGAANPYDTRISSGPTAAVYDPAREWAVMEGLKRKVIALRSQFDEFATKATNLSAVASTIHSLEGELVAQRALLQQYQSSLQSIRTDAELNLATSTIMPVAEWPTPPYRDRGKSIKISLGMALGGVALALGWAFLIELVFDHSVKRVKDIEGGLGLQVLLSLPRVSRKMTRMMEQKSRLLLTAGNSEGGAGETATQALTEPGAPIPATGAAADLAWRNHNAALQSYYEALRDRLISYFDVRNLTHKPKLVAVTGAGARVGASTIAVGLAASLSETGEGNVLLVDMNLENGAAHQFFKGKAICELNEALEDGTRETAFIQKNLYAASGNANRDKLPRILPKRFANLLPKLKASDYDYIIFDMPAVSQTSITPRLAGFMDIVLMVVESEKTNKESVQRANALMAETKANVKVILNKTQAYVPARLVADV